MPEVKYEIRKTQYRVSLTDFLLYNTTRRYITCEGSVASGVAGMIGILLLTTSPARKVML